MGRLLPDQWRDTYRDPWMNGMTSVDDRSVTLLIDAVEAILLSGYRLVSIDSHRTGNHRILREDLGRRA
jgi:hypothetical protein